MNLFENWNESRDALLEGLTPDKKEIVAQCLENTKRHVLNETATSGAIQAHDVANFRQQLMPLIRRVIPGTIAPEIVGVQAMKSAVDQVRSLRYHYNSAVATHANANDEMHPTGVSISANDEAFGNSPSIRSIYSGSATAVGGAGVAQAASAGGFGPGAAAISAEPSDGQAWGSSSDSTTYSSGSMDFGGYSVPVGGSLLGGSSSHIESSGGRSMGLTVVTQAVEARGRKLQAAWTIEADMDFKANDNLSLENEMLKGLTSQIVQDVDNEIISDLLALAGTVRAFNFSSTGGTTYAPTYVGDRLANIGVMINAVANEIARKTRLGEGNFIVVSPMMVSVLQAAAKSAFAPAVAGSFAGPNDTRLVGTLNGSIKVYSYLWNQAYDGSDGAPAGSDQILVGLKKNNSQQGAGYYYCPLLPVSVLGRMQHPTSFDHIMMLGTRYGKAIFTDPNTSLGNSADYYGRINVTNLTFV